MRKAYWYEVRQTEAEWYVWEYNDAGYRYVASCNHKDTADEVAEALVVVASDYPLRLGRVPPS